ncbi:hypothetical protein ACN4EE_02075 [Geminocystis sp. CENA526]
MLFSSIFALISLAYSQKWLDRQRRRCAIEPELFSRNSFVDENLCYGNFH